MEGLLEDTAISAAKQRQQAHLLLDALSVEKLSAVHGLLEVLAQPLTLAQSLAMAPTEDEDLTQEMTASLLETDASLDRGEFVSHEEILREFGLRTD